MAKTSRYSGGAYTVNSTAKDIVWTIDDTYKNFKLEFETSEDYTGIGTSESAYTVGYKDGNDLVLVTNFLIKKNNSVKSVKNTIKNYFKTEGASVEFYDVTGDTWLNLDTADVLNYVSGTVVSSTATLFYSAEDTKTKFLGSKKADTYNLFNYNNTGEDNHGLVYDEAGNDKYIAYNSAYYDIYDFKGNDNYKYSSTHLKINDYTGNDKYMSNSAVVDVTDFQGNDSYTASISKENSKITDYKGNDLYSVMSNTEYFTIKDYTGNDKYEMIDSVFTINEYDEGKTNKSGNDIYNIYSPKSSTINELSSNSGNDTYNIKSEYVPYPYTSMSIFDAAGNDKYNVTTSINLNVYDNLGNDKYNFNLASTSSITDDKGNDNYNLNSSDVNIEDNDGKDKYVLTNDSNYCEITDKDGNDTYLLEDSRNNKIYDLGKSNDKYTFKNVNNMNAGSWSIQPGTGVTVYSYPSAADNGGSDTYNITDSKNVGIYDISATSVDTAKKDKNTFNVKNSGGFNIEVNLRYTKGNSLTMPSSIDTYNITSSSGTIKDYDEQNDTYKVNKLTGKLTIQDDGGDKDKLIISGTKANNLILFGNTGWSDLTGTGTRGADNSLYIYDTSANAYIKLENYFDNFGNIQTAEGTGVIESIKVGGKEVGNIDTTKISSIQGTVANWLKTNEYMTIGEVLDNAVNNGTDISGLIACFTNA